MEHRISDGRLMHRALDQSSTTVLTANVHQKTFTIPHQSEDLFWLQMLNTWNRRLAILNVWLPGSWPCL